MVPNFDPYPYEYPKLPSLFPGFAINAIDHQQLWIIDHWGTPRWWLCEWQPLGEFELCDKQLTVKAQIRKALYVHDLIYNNNILLYTYSNRQTQTYIYISCMLRQVDTGF